MAPNDTFDAISALVDLGEATDLVGDWDTAISMAILARYLKKMGRERA